MSRFRLTETEIQLAREAAADFHAPQAAVFRQLWAEALIKRQFRRGHFNLFDGDCYCPLGVACELMRRFTGHGKWVYDGVFWGFQWEGKTYTQFPPDDVLELFGIDVDDAHTITALNDGMLVNTPSRLPIKVRNRYPVARIAEFITDFCGK